MATADSARQDCLRMRRALALARRGGARVSPNPQVGCVLVRAGRVVAEGWHSRFGGPHAEAMALERAGRRARRTTAYVNLEPCCHTRKKTPPCTRALVAAGVRRVVVGMRDPNPQVAGNGIRELRRAGIGVTVGILQKECEAINRPFAVRMKKRRPYVILKAAASLDGRLETASGESKWITSLEARRTSRRMRARVDAILVGVGTVLKDDPRLTADGNRNPLRVVLDSRLRVPPRARVLDGTAPTLIATARRDGTFPRAFRNVSVAHIPRRGSELDLKRLLRYLLDLGIGTLLVEGGSRVHTSFLEAGLVDELRLFLAPRLIGGQRARGFFEGRGVARLSRALEVSGTTVRRIGSDFLVAGLIN